ncbi:MAG: ABC transporter ATP-binding protein [Cyanobacteria bacterium P01_H01_bin.15]
MMSALPSVSTEPSTEVVVSTQGLGKTYRTGFWLNKKLITLQNCSLTIHRGETFGLLGPNGAGKTTLLKILLGIARPSTGQGTVLGKPFGDRKTKEHLGYLPENAYYPDRLTAWEYLSFIGGLFQMPRSQLDKRIPELLDMVGLAQSAATNKQMRQYSKGMLQRVGLAQAIINDPDIVFLDEPMSGLDPLGRYLVREIIRSLQTQGKTIFFNSHILGDVETICDRIAILSKGKLLCSGSLTELLGLTEAYQVILKGGTLAQLEPWLVKPELDGHFWQGQLRQEPAALLAALPELNIELVSIKRDRPSLETFFVDLIRDQEPNAVKASDNPIA